MCKYLFEVEGASIDEKSFFKGSCVAENIEEVLELFDSQKYYLCYIGRGMKVGNHYLSGVSKLEIMSQEYMGDVSGKVKHEYIVLGKEIISGENTIMSICVALGIIDVVDMFRKVGFDVYAISQGDLVCNECNCSILNTVSASGEYFGFEFARKFSAFSDM